jgi:hypothetical protein
MSLLSPSRAPIIDSVSAVSFLISRQGDAKLAAIDATRELGHEVTAAQLLTVISGDPQAATLLGQQARVLVMLRMLEAFKLLDMAFKAAIPALQPRDAARAYTDLASSLAQVAPPQAAAPIDPFTAVLNKLPPEIRDAVEYFAQQPDPQTSQPGSSTVLSNSRASTSATRTGSRPMPPVQTAALEQKFLEATEDGEEP